MGACTHLRCAHGWLVHKLRAAQANQHVGAVDAEAQCGDGGPLQPPGGAWGEDRMGGEVGAGLPMGMWGPWMQELSAVMAAHCSHLGGGVGERTGGVESWSWAEDYEGGK